MLIVYLCNQMNFHCKCKLYALPGKCCITFSASLSHSIKLQIFIIVFNNFLLHCRLFNHRRLKSTKFGLLQFCSVHTNVRNPCILASYQRHFRSVNMWQVDSCIEIPKVQVLLKWVYKTSYLYKKACNNQANRMETAPLPKTRIRPTSFQADQRDTEKS